MQLILMLIVVMSWGGSWYAILLQLGEVPPLVSIAYRFVLASLFLALWLFFTNRLKWIKWSKHGMLLLLGICLFSMNFYCFYISGNFIPSGLNAVIFATAAIMGAFNQRVFLKTSLSKQVLLGACIGIIGLCFIFWDGKQFEKFETYYILIPLLGTFLFSTGNMLSLKLSQELELPNIVLFGMIYGSTICFAIIFISGIPIVIPQPSNIKYWYALIYLAIIASVIAFLAYLSLVNRAGPARAAYVTVLFPIVAMAISTFLEGYEWTINAFIGITLSLGGTLLVFLKPRSVK